MHLFLVDSSIFIFKAWFGNDKTLVNLEQQPNQAFIGFTDFVYRLLTEQAPGKIVFAFDESLTKSTRREIYPQYKANRSPAPDELKRQFAWCQNWIEALGISRVSSSSWEADDLIGSLVRYHRSPLLPVTLLTADKDLTQLIAEGDLWWSYPDKKLDYRAIIKKFGVRPQQIADLLALMGDKADNIPGIPGVGRKTAASLLKKFDNLEELRLRLSEVHQMKIRYAMQVQQALIENQAILDISAQLTRINCEIEDMKLVEIERKAADSEHLAAMMRQQAMDARRQARWNRFLESAALQVD
jgi:5'-3' exonuclease